MKKILGLVTAIVGLILFLSLYIVMVLLKEESWIGYVILGVGYISILMFFGGVYTYVKNR